MDSSAAALRLRNVLQPPSVPRVTVDVPAPQRVSIILPLYKSADYVLETIASVQAQTWTDWELIVVDDGSPDDSADKVEALGDPRIRIFRRRNQGSCRARNFGIEQAEGGYIAFIDHDDLWRPEKLQRHLDHLARRPRVGLSYGPSELIDAQGAPLGAYQVGALTGVTPRLMLCRDPIGNGSTPLIRVELMRAVRFEVERDGQPEAVYFDDEAVGWEDVELWVRMLVKTDWEMEGIPDCLTLYRVTPGGITDHPEKKQQAFERGLAVVARYAPELVREHGPAARAYHLRFLARRMVMSRQPQQAIGYAHRAVLAWPGIVKEEPARTGITLAAAWLQRLLPGPIYSLAESLGMKQNARQQAKKVQ